MLKTVSRRIALSLSLALPLGCALAVATPGIALAQGGDVAFVKSLGDRLVAVVNGNDAAAQKRSETVALVDGNVDVDGIARFCLGRYWHSATPEQQQRFVTLFHQVLTNSITDKLGAYRGVTFSVGQEEQRDGASFVSTVINRPGQPPATVQWKIDHAGAGPKVTDVVAEGVSLSLTQRNDYSSYLARHGGKVDTLLDAMQAQVSRHG